MWSLSRINPVNKIMGKRLINDKISKGKEEDKTHNKNEEKDMLEIITNEKYGKGVEGEDFVFPKDVLKCPGCGKVLNRKYKENSYCWKCLRE